MMGKANILTYIKGGPNLSIHPLRVHTITHYSSTTSPMTTIFGSKKVLRSTILVVMSNFSSYSFPTGGADQEILPGSPEKWALLENPGFELSVTGLKG